MLRSAQTCARHQSRSSPSRICSPSTPATARSLAIRPRTAPRSWRKSSGASGTAGSRRHRPGAAGALQRQSTRHDRSASRRRGRSEPARPPVQRLAVVLCACQPPIVRGADVSSPPPARRSSSTKRLRNSSWGTADPIGQRFIAGGDYSRSDHIVVGVVRDSPFVSLLLRDEPFMFRPLDPSGGGAVVARTAGPAAVVARAANGGRRARRSAAVDCRDLMADGIEAGNLGAARAGAGVVGGVGGSRSARALRRRRGHGECRRAAHARDRHTNGARRADLDATSLIVRQSMRPVSRPPLGLLAAALVGGR